MSLISIGTRLRSVTVGYTLRLHSFPFEINAVTPVTLPRARIRARISLRGAKDSRAHGILQTSVTRVTTLIFNGNKRNRRV